MLTSLASNFLDRRAGSAVHAVMSWQHSKSRSRILYLEDEAIIAIEVSETLREMGPMDVMAAMNLDQARRHLESGLPDAAILDINLGRGQNSLDLGRDLIAAGVPVVFATGYSATSLDLPKGFVAVLAKPFIDRDLLGVVRAALSSVVAPVAIA